MMWRSGAKWDEMEEIFYSEQNFVMEHFLVETISKVHLEVMKQPNPNKVAKTVVMNLNWPYSTHPDRP